MTVADPDVIGRPYRKRSLPALAGRPCAVCGQPAAAWDHCHDHGIVRGPLCRSCNACQAAADSGRGFVAGSQRLPRERQAAREAGQRAYAEARTAGADRGQASAARGRAIRAAVRDARRAVAAAVEAHRSRCPHCAERAVSGAVRASARVLQA